jgi:hypothetical protein
MAGIDRQELHTLVDGLRTEIDNLISFSTYTVKILGSPNHSATRQGERSAHVLRAAVAHAVDLSEWQTLQAFGIFKASLVAGVTNRNVWLATFTSAIVGWIFGMWQEMHSLPWLPAL